MAIASFVEELARLRAFYRQSAQHERTGSKAEVLARLLPLHADAGDRVGAAQFLF
jgi:hypothetical protein